MYLPFSIVHNHIHDTLDFPSLRPWLLKISSALLFQKAWNNFTISLALRFFSCYKYSLFWLSWQNEGLVSVSGFMFHKTLVNSVIVAEHETSAIFDGGSQSIDFRDSPKLSYIFLFNLFSSCNGSYVLSQRSWPLFMFLHLQLSSCHSERKVQYSYISDPILHFVWIWPRFFQQFLCDLST